MDRLRIPQLALVALATTLPGACVDEQVTAPVERDASRTGQRQYPDLSWGKYGTWLELANKIPGYGGHFLDFDNARVVWVYLLDPESQAHRAKSVLSQRANHGGAGMAPVVVRTLKARYSAVDLMRWHTRIHEIMGGDLWGTGLAFHKNQITLHVNPGTDLSMVQRRIKSLGIPLDAVRIVEDTLPPELDFPTR